MDQHIEQPYLKYTPPVCPTCWFNLLQRVQSFHIEVSVGKSISSSQDGSPSIFGTVSKKYYLR